MREDTSILESAEKLFDNIESSCRNGVCTTCAGKVLYLLFLMLVYYLHYISFLILPIFPSYVQIIEGKENTKLAVHGLGEPQIAAGFICTCQCYPTGPGVVIKLAAYEEVYESQYGQFELSYGDLKYPKKEEGAKVVEKKKNLFGF